MKVYIFIIGILILAPHSNALEINEFRSDIDNAYIDIYALSDNPISIDNYINSDEIFTDSSLNYIWFNFTGHAHMNDRIIVGQLFSIINGDVEVLSNSNYLPLYVEDGRNVISLLYALPSQNGIDYFIETIIINHRSESNIPVNYPLEYYIEEKSLFVTPTIINKSRISPELLSPELKINNMSSGAVLLGDLNLTATAYSIGSSEMKSYVQEKGKYFIFDQMGLHELNDGIYLFPGENEISFLYLTPLGFWTHDFDGITSMYDFDGVKTEINGSYDYILHGDRSTFFLQTTITNETHFYFPPIGIALLIRSWRRKN